MYEYIVFTILFTVIAFLLNKKHTILFLVFSFIVLVFFASSKSILVGTDSTNYYDYFIYNEEFSDNHIFQGTQRIWWYFNYCISLFFGYDIFLIICYLIAYMGVFISVKKYSFNPFLSILYFVLMYFYFSSYNVMRQYMSLGIVMIGYGFLINKDRLKYVCCLVIAAFFHFSAIVAFPLLFIEKLKINNKLIVTILTIVTFLMGFVFYNVSNYLIVLFSILMGDTKYSIYFEGFNPNERNLLTNIIINIIFLISYYLCKNRNDFFMKLYFLFILFSNLVGAIGQGNRIFLYFQIAVIIVFSNVYMSLKSKILASVYFIFILIYSIGVFYISLISNNGEIVPYSIR